MTFIIIVKKMSRTKTDNFLEWLSENGFKVCSNKKIIKANFNTSRKNHYATWDLITKQVAESKQRKTSKLVHDYANVVANSFLLKRSALLSAPKTGVLGFKNSGGGAIYF